MSLPKVALLSFTALLPIVSSGGQVQKLDHSQPEVQQFVEEMRVEHGFDEEQLKDLLAQVEIKQSILDAISRPAEKTVPWHKYRGIFLNQERIERGVEFWNENRDLVEQTASAFGIPPEIVVAILGVETLYGRRIGGYRVIDALSTLAFAYPPRSRFFRSELKQFLLLSREESVEVLEATGSYAGAMGLPQFMPSSYRTYAVDSDSDGRRDLWGTLDDVLGSIANYLDAHGWQKDYPVAIPARISSWRALELRGESLELKETVGSLREKGLTFETDLPDDTRALLITLDGQDGKEYWVGFKNFYVLTRYNRSLMYAMAIHQLGQEIAGGLKPLS